MSQGQHRYTTAEEELIALFCIREAEKEKIFFVVYEGRSRDKTGKETRKEFKRRKKVRTEPRKEIREGENCLYTIKQFQLLQSTQRHNGQTPSETKTSRLRKQKCCSLYMSLWF